MTLLAHVARAARPDQPPAAEWWQEYWREMPAFVQNDVSPYRSLDVIFRSAQDRAAFEQKLGQTAPDGERYTPNIWYPEAEIGRFAEKEWVADPAEEQVLPHWPIYVVSKGRARSQLTSRSLSEMGVPHHVVVEAQERRRYEAEQTDCAKIIVLDPKYQREYETLDDLGATKSKGPGPARNFAWAHALAHGYDWHWVMDDNIRGFYRLHYNLKTPARCGAIFRAMEAFCQRYDNVMMAGPNYFMFASRKSKQPPFVLNTRIYSCNLIRNDMPWRWRGRYNEDTDLSLMILKAGLCTVQFNAFLQFKVTTQTLKGGNTKEFYAKEGTAPKSEMLARVHPDVARKMWRWGRAHHYVDYSGFDAKLKPRWEDEAEATEDEFGMRLRVRGRLVDDPSRHLP